MTRRLLFTVALAAVMAGSATAFAGLSVPANTIADATVQGNYVDVRQFTIHDSQVPGTSVRQNVTAWQVNLGRWNGQNLDGLSVVLVEQYVSEGAGRTVACYVSEFATPAQREALLAALQSSQPRLKEMTNIRLEPATIRLDIDGMTAVIHLGLIA